MPLDLEQLLAPVSEADPAGPDLSYDPRRHAIEQAFDAPVSIESNGAPGAEGDFDWRHIIAHIEEQSAQTKDFWLAVYLCRAGVRSGRFEVLETGQRYLLGLIEQFWNEAHPALDEYGVEGRTGACGTLASYREFIGPLRAAALIDHPRHGSFTGADLLRFERGGEAEEGYGSFRATLDDPASADRLQDLAARLATIETLFHAIDGAIAERAGAGAGASFAPLFAALAEIRGAVNALLPSVPDPLPPEDPDAPGPMPAETASPALARIGSRTEVKRAIELIVDYYRRSEPNSPVPLLMERAREWVDRDFLSLLEDIAPQALSDARLVLQHRRGDG